MEFENVSAAAWRAQVEKELAGAPFDKALVHTTPEGFAVQPLYTEPHAARTGLPGEAPFTRGTSASPAPFRVCMAHPAYDAAALDDDLAGGAEALWLRPGAGFDAQLARVDLRRVELWIDTETPLAALAALLEGASKRGFGARALCFVLATDPIGSLAQGRVVAPSGTLEDALGEMALAARFVSERAPFACGACVSTLPYRAAGADAADEIALALSAGAAYLGALLDAGLDVRAAARLIAVQVTVGRDTFGELCKLRALRTCWHKLVAAAQHSSDEPAAKDLGDAPLAHLHAVCAPATLAARDPWVNMLRVSTQVFAAVLGGANTVTPQAYDAALGDDRSSALGRRVARNTCLVLREESHLGRVLDPAGGSYYLEARTDALAREAWSRFRQIESQGGVAAMLANGSLRARLDASWEKQRDAVARRKIALVGVSEFAAPSEPPKPSAPAARPPRPRDPVPSVAEPLLRAFEAAPSGSVARFDALLSAARAGVPFDALARASLRPVAHTPPAPLPARRDAEPFEGLRGRFDALALEGSPIALALVTMGPFAEHRLRLGFAQSFFAIAGLHAREGASDAVVAKGSVACLCGTDERYASEAAERAAALKSAGYARVLLAGRPGSAEFEKTLRAAGVDGFIYAGCDAVATLTELLGAPR